MKDLGYAGFGFAMGSLASLIISFILIALRLIPSRMFYAVLILLVFVLGVIGTVFCTAQLTQKDYPFVAPTLILNLILIVISIMLILL